MKMFQQPTTLKGSNRRRPIGATLLTLGLLLLLSTVSATAQIRAVAIATPDSLLSSADQAFRVAVEEAMSRAADSFFDVFVETSDLVAVSRDDILLVNAGVRGFESASSSARMLVIDMGVIYLSTDAEIRFGDGLRGRVPAGFYLVRATVDQGTRAADPGVALVELISSSGRTTTEFHVATLPPSPLRKLTASVDLNANTGEGEACVDWHGKKVSIEICLSFTF